MGSNIGINSKIYWDKRFSDDWHVLGGGEQSKFFGMLALKLMPNWLLKMSGTWCDWGCARGEGTYALAQKISGAKFTGVDFSKVAIADAKSSFPDCNFIDENWLESTSSDITLKFDVLFSSNTLEHFIDPWTTLEKIAIRAKKCIVLMLPYREKDRIDEHFSSFFPENIPRQIGGKVLIYSRVYDTKKSEPCFWHGEQILLIWASPEWLALQNFALQDLLIEHDQSVSLRDDNRKLIITQGEINKKIEKLKCENNQLTLMQKKLRTELDELHSSTSWRITRPIRIIRRLLADPVKETKHVRYKLKILYKKKFHLNAAESMDISRLPKLEKANSHLEDVFVWSVIDWHFRIQRPQHLANALAAQGRRVFYISNNFIDSPTPGFKIETLNAGDRLFQVNLNLSGAPQIYHDMPDLLQIDSLQKSLSALLTWTQSERCLSIVDHPFWMELSQCVPNAKIIYDCMDHHAGFSDNSEAILAAESSLVKRADLVIVSSQWLHDELKNSAKNIKLIRNATDYHHFSVAPKNIFFDPKSRKIIGYYGAIENWLDENLIRDVAENNPDALVVMVGADTNAVSKRLSHIKNIKFIGEVPYSHLPYWLYSFDVCLLPFKIIPLTLATNPVKVYEYLSAGKTVVSVNLPELSQFEGMVRIANNSRDFLEQVNQALKENTNNEMSAMRKAFAAKQTWSHRAEILNLSIDSIEEPLISIIVLSYNNLNYTKKCLHSLNAYTEYKNIEIILIDNASTDGSREFLQRWEDESRNRILILNNENVGFSAGNNLGLNKARGEYIVILNNDTYVTPGWLRTLRNHFCRNPKLGLIGPVTNNIGNEAKIDISYESMEQMITLAGDYTRLHTGRTFPITTLAFFCVMMPRKIFDQVGNLDENYGLGFFEDDDYCRRVEKCGFEILCAEDVFVHHELSASFNALDTDFRKKLFERNKNLYESKWGKWREHSLR